MKIKIKVSGMSCNHCVKSVTEAINKVDGVKSCEVSLSGAYAIVAFDENKTTSAKIVSAIDNTGFEADSAFETL